MAKETAVFGGGCFWCVEAVFKMLRGVSAVKPGYAGGHTRNPTYAEVSTGNTGHAEVVYLEYDPKEANYKDQLTIFFASHDPTTLNRQGMDAGTQYRSVIFYTTPKQKELALNFIKKLNASSGKGKPVVTEVEPLDEFYEAESYHKDYFQNHQATPYCQIVISPKLEKVQKQFSGLLKSFRE